MPVSQLDRKLLWARAHNRCALCRCPLTVSADTEALAGLVLGQEAHIVARSPTGPRGSDREGVRIDAYENLILLCPSDHKRIDDQPDAFPAERLTRLKADHEEWAEGQHDDQTPEPIHLVADPGEGVIALQPIVSGRQLWEIVAEAHAFTLSSLDESHSAAEVDLADQFLQNAKDWGEIASAVAGGGLPAVRDAQRDLDSDLNLLWSAGIYAWGNRVRRTIAGGLGPPGTWWVAQLATRTIGDLASENAGTNT